MATKTGEQRAERQDRSVDRLRDVAAATAFEVADAVARNLAAALASQSRGDAAVALRGVNLVEVIAAMSVVGHQAAIVDVRRDLGGPMAFAVGDALATARRALQLDDEQVASLSERYGEAALGLVRGASPEANRALLRAYDAALADNLHVDGTATAIERRLKRAGVLDGFAADITTLARTQLQIAYTAGARETDRLPEIQEILWGYEYVTVGDDRVRPSHAALDGTRLPKDDPLWSTIMPPNGYNCRCQVIRIFTTDSVALRTPKPPGVAVEAADGSVRRVSEAEAAQPNRNVVARGGPDEGFAFNPIDVVAAVASAR